MVWTLDQGAYNQADPTAVGTGVTATFSSTPTEGDELVAYAIARPDNNSPSTNVLSMSGWTKMAQADTTSHSIAIFHKTAGASEPTGHTLTATMTGDTDMVCALYIQEFSGGTFDTADVTEASNSGGSNVASFSDSTGALSSQPQLCVAIGTIRASSTGTLTWDGTNRPTNDPLASQIPTSGTFAFIARTGWEELTATTARTFEVDASSSAQGAMVIVAWPEAGGATTVNPVGSVSSPVSGTANVTAEAAITPTGSVSSPVSGTGSVSGTTDVAPTGSVSSSVSATADVTGGTNVNPTGSVSTTVSATAGIDAAADVTGTGSVSSPVSATADVTGAAGETTVNPVGSVSTTVSATSNVTGETDIAPTGSVSSPVSAQANVTATTDVTPTGSVSTTVSGTASVSTQTVLNGVGSVSATVSATANVTAVADIAPGGSYAVTVSATANLIVGALATDTRHAAVYREPAYAATYREPAYAARYREPAYAPTYRG